ncbi:hypothetical protein COT82_00955 [Candidatus Campbellbacteria bacterium CG10_big_fil_rev_8_21_14_0_10_35_52]|uniref:Uncharacterized protein n=1 Tax=Candidatus Campbellbacteria bacterium CG10_big_fil_rev_8_21_14_0_10_35_52 TaxID=1974527 RepID=A0A2M6WVL9_9BACT|nr:MAG: hypothetical protein COT82_00955 [Candidatus Campbellbacteria bacterium CG10_big_fil_rev_8_21_14_0_10_35_52]
MTIKNNIKNFFKKRNKKTKRYEYNISSAERIWKIIFTIFILLNIAIAVFSGYLFFQINDGEIFKTGIDESFIINTIDRTILRDTLSLFEEKAFRFEELEKNNVIIADPSL